MPETLRSLIASRLDALEPADRELLQDASVLGQVFSAEALAAVTGSDADELEAGCGTSSGASCSMSSAIRARRSAGSTASSSRSSARSPTARSRAATVATRHLAAARYYEALGDDELAGALASHYLAAHEASDEGAEADAVAAQARLALTAAAERAASSWAPTSRPSPTSSRLSP